MRVLVTIPTYNEAENLPKLVSALYSLPMESLDILVIDDNSPDGTGQIANALAGEHAGRMFVMHRAGKLGLGTAYISAFQWALQHDYEAVAQMDADFSHPPEKLVELEQTLQHTDLVMGSRYVPGGGLDERWPFWRKALSGFGNTYARTILGLPIRDVTGGFRMWRRETLQGIPLERVHSNGYVFQVEMAYITHRCGFHFAEIPIYFADRRWGKSKMSFRIQVEAAVRVWRLKGLYRDLKR